MRPKYFDEMNESERLDVVFGECAGDTPEERARNSDRRYVASWQQVAEWSPEATGRQLTASEALAEFGLKILTEVALDGSASIIHRRDGLPRRNA